MKKNKDSSACQVQALKHLEQITRKQGKIFKCFAFETCEVWVE